MSVRCKASYWSIHCLNQSFVRGGPRPLRSRHPVEIGRPLLEFGLVIDVAHMLNGVLARSPEQLCHLLLGQPHRLPGGARINTSLAISRMVDRYLPGIIARLIDLV